MGGFKQFYSRILILLLAGALVCSGCAGTAGTQDAELSPSGSLSVSGTPAEENPSALWNGQPYTAVNGNVPGFSEKDLTAASFESYSELDSLGRCGTAFACLGQDLMPRGEKKSLQPLPSHWLAALRRGCQPEESYYRNPVHECGGHASL